METRVMGEIAAFGWPVKLLRSRAGTRYSDKSSARVPRIGVNVNMANWSETELAELGPMLRGYVEASLPRGPDAQRAACTNCGEKFGDHPGRRSRFCQACRPQERLRAAREGMRRLRAYRREFAAPAGDVPHAVPMATAR